MIAADTSTWVAYLEGVSGNDTLLLDRALQDRQVVMVPVVLTELLSDPQLPPTLAAALADVPMLPVEPGFWQRAMLPAPKFFPPAAAPASANPSSLSLASMRAFRSSPAITTSAPSPSRPIHISPCSPDYFSSSPEKWAKLGALSLRTTIIHLCVPRSSPGPICRLWISHFRFCAAYSVLDVVAGS